MEQPVRMSNSIRTGVQVREFISRLYSFDFDTRYLEDKKIENNFLEKETQFCFSVLDLLKRLNYDPVMVYFNVNPDDKVICASTQIRPIILKKYRTSRGSFFSLLDGILSKKDENNNVNQEEITIIRPGFLALVKFLRENGIKVGLIGNKSTLGLYMGSKGYGNQKCIPELSDIVDYHIGGASIDPSQLSSSSGVNECRSIETRLHEIENTRWAVLVDCKRTSMTSIAIDSHINEGRLILLPEALRFSNPYPQKR